MIPTDLWRAGIVEAAMIALIDAGLLDGFKTKQRPAEGWPRFTTDPFGCAGTIYFIYSSEPIIIPAGGS